MPIADMPASKQQSSVACTAAIDEPSFYALKTNGRCNSHFTRVGTACNSIHSYVLLLCGLSTTAAGELAFWAPPDTHVVTYSGTVAARNTLHEHEMWLQPSSMDGKLGSGSAAGTSGRAALSARVPKPDVVLTTYEAVCSDVHVLAGMAWSSIIVDRRQRTRSAAGKAQAALQELAAGHRLVLSSHGLKAVPDQLFTLLSFVKPGSYEAITDVVPAYAVEPEQQVGFRVCSCCWYSR
jgi:hypothetical protein